MAYSSGQIATILLKADKTMYKLGDVAYDDMFSELDEAYDYERDIIFIYKKAVEYGDDYFVGTLKLDQIIERLAAKLNIYDYGILSPIYVDVYTQVDQGLNIIYVLKTTALDLGPGLTGDTDFSQSQIDIDLDYAYLNTVYVIDERSLTINGVTYDLSSNRSWSVNLQSITTQGATTTDKITVGGVGLTGMTAGSGALYYNAGSNRVTVANYNAGGSVYVEVNGGSYSAVFGPDLSFTSYGTIAGVFNNATVDTDRFLVSDGGVIKYRTGAQLLSDIGGQPSGNYVPYVGATQNVDLGEYEIKAGQFTLDVSPTGTATVGTTRWNNDIGSSETTLKGGTVILKNGVDLVARVVNKVFPNATLTKAQYQAVRVAGAQGQRLAVAYAQANNDNNSADTIGLVTETIPTNQEGFIMTVGQLEGINTTGSLQGETWSDGDVLYLSPTIPGALTNVKPIAPQHLVVIGYVEYAHANNGKIYVKVMNGWELGELHDVTTVGAVAGSVLKYNGTIWTPSSDIDTGITSLNGLTALSQTFATGTSGTDFNISSSTSTHTFNLPTASASVRGALSSTDWTTFNNKQNALTLTTLGSSGASTLVGATLNIPNYSIGGLGGVPTLRTLTINGTTYDLSADRTWSVGTVTSVDMSVPTGFAISGNPITSSGTLALAFAAGYSLPTTSSQANWDAAYNDKINSAAVTGTTTKTLTLTQQDGGTITASWTDDNTDAVTSVFGRTGAVVAQSGDYTTTQVTEGTNLYYTNARGIGSTLTGYVSGAGTITSADTILSAIQKLNGNIGALVTGVSSVNGFTGAVTLTTTNIAEGTNLYYTDARSRAALSFAAGSGAYNSTTGVITIPTNTNQLTNGAAFITLGSLSASAPLSYNNGTGAFTISQASSTTNGFLSSTDWNTFNNKQNALTNPVTGTGTTNTLPKFTGASTIGNSLLTDDGITLSYGNNIVTIGASNTSEKYLQINSSTGNLYLGGTSGEHYIYGAGNKPINFYTNGTSKMLLNASGNLGLGVTPSAWSIGKGFDINGGMALLSVSNASFVLNNAYYNGGWIYKASSFAQNFLLNNDGSFQFNIAPSGTAGNAISFTQAMTLNASGNLSIGNTNDTYKLDVSGNIYGTIGDSTFILSDANNYARFTSASGNAQVGLFRGTPSDGVYIGGSNQGFQIYNSNFSSVLLRVTQGSNVLIGTTTDSGYRLDVSGTGRFTGALTGTSATFSGNVRKTGAAGVYTELQSDGVYATGTDLYLLAPSTKGVYIYTNNTQALLISSTGAATFSSSVTATSFIKSGGTSSQYLMADGSTSTLTNPVTGTGSTNYLPKFTGSTTIGNSSIQDGTSSVTYTYSTNPIFNVTDGTNTTRLGVATTAGAYVDIAKANDGFIRVKNGLAIGTSDGFYGTYFDVNGNLGLGTNNPVVKLELIGNYRQKALVGNSNGFNISINSSTDVVSLINYYNAGLVFGVNNAEGMRLTSTGLGIGTTTFATDSKLAVQTSGGKFDVRGIGVASIVLESNGGMHYNAPTGNFHKFQINNSTLMELNGSGNLGLGVTPSAWNSSFNVIQIGSTGSIYSRTSGTEQMGIASNAYFASGTNDWRYITSTNASYYLQSSGIHYWLTAPSGTAGNAITFTQAMTLTASGRLLLGTTTEGTYLLDVNGGSRFTGASGARILTLNAPTDGGSLTFESGGTAYADMGSNKAIFGTGSATNFYIGTRAGSTLTFGTETTARLFLDTSGNLGLGVTPSAWGITPALQVVNASLYNQGDDGTYITSNGYYNAGWKYIGTSTATQYQMLSGQHRWYTAASGTAGNAISFTQAMTLFSTGNLAVGGTSDAGYRLDITGTGRFSGDLTTNAVLYGNRIDIRSGNKLILWNPTNTEYSYWETNGSNTAIWGVGGVSKITFTSTGAATFSSTIQTAAPTGYTAQPWKLGDATSGTLTPNYYIKVEINGQIYSIPALQGTP